MSAFLREQLHESARHVQPLGDIDKAITSGIRRGNRTFAVVAVVGMTCAVIVAAVVWGAGPGGSQPEPLPQPKPSPSPYSAGNGWPDTTRNAPGVYALDGHRCGSEDDRPHSCNFGFMHNGFASTSSYVSIRIEANPKGAAEVDPGSGALEDGASVVVAGYEGTYRRIDARRDMWIVDIEGTRIVINLEADPGTSQADLAEAHAIIDSMRTEPDNNDIGFSLVFTIRSNDWDSG